MTLIAHLSDTHFDGHARNAARTQQVLDYLHALPGRVDAIVVTGDITDNGLPEELAQAQAVLQSPIPLYTCPGNHDGYQGHAEPHNAVHDLGGVTLVLCDSVIERRDDGRFSDQTLDWLAGALAAAPDEKPVLIAFHHPPVSIGHELIDSINLDDRSQQRLAALMAEHPKVSALLCGHTHTATAAGFAGRPVLTAPGIASSLNLPWEVDGELTWKNTVDFAPQPGLALHVVGGDGRIVTHFRFIGEWSST